MGVMKTINVSEDLHERIKSLAQDEGKKLHIPNLSMSDFIGRLVGEYERKK